MKIKEKIKQEYNTEKDECKSEKIFTTLLRT